jgi:hypothetical protein
MLKRPSKCSRPDSTDSRLTDFTGVANQTPKIDVGIIFDNLPFFNLKIKLCRYMYLCRYVRRAILTSAVIALHNNDKKLEKVDLFELFPKFFLFLHFPIVI